MLATEPQKQTQLLTDCKDVVHSGHTNKNKAQLIWSATEDWTSF